MCDNERVKSENETISLHYVLISGRCEEKSLLIAVQLCWITESLFLGQNGRLMLVRGFRACWEGL